MHQCFMALSAAFIVLRRDLIERRVRIMASEAAQRTALAEAGRLAQIRRLMARSPFVSPVTFERVPVARAAELINLSGA
jgi:hypothetical protein